MYSVIVTIIFGSLVNRISAHGCADCYHVHPQQLFCDADFVFHLVVTSVEPNAKIPNYGDDFYNLITSDVLKDLKPGLVDSGTTVTFYSPISLCGTWFHLNREYIVTGSIIESSNETEKYLLHGNCDFSEEWEELSPRQQKGFEFKYGRMCACQVPGVKSEMILRVTDMEGGSGYEGAHSFWTPRGCYYNPFKSEKYDCTDCENEFGFCKPDDDSDEGTCSWQMTIDYESCFSKRETFILALEGSPAITDVKQCKILPRRQRRKCRKRVKENLQQLHVTVETEE